MKAIRALLAALLFSVPAQAQIVGSLPYNFTNGSVADATQVMANYNYIASQVNANSVGAGVNSTITAITGLTVPLSASQGGSQIFTAGTSAGTANAQAVATGVVPAGFALSGKPVVVFIAGLTNTGATTLAFNGTAATAVTKLTPSGSVALTGGEIVSGALVQAVFNGSTYTLITNNLSLIGPQTTLASAATTDLGTINTHNMSISGTTTVTSFGSTATTDTPVYYLKFTGALVLTQNATSLILPGAANITTAAGDTAQAMYLNSGNWQVIQYTRNAAAPNPTVQTFLTGSGTATPAAGVVRWKVTMSAGGGGGAANITNNGASGSSSSLGSWTALGAAGGGVGGGFGGTGGTGGVNGTGTLIVRLPGGRGGGGQYNNGTASGFGGGNGGGNPLGGAPGVSQQAQPGLAAPANTGAGGSGTSLSGTGFGSGGGGGAGEYVQFYVSNPTALAYVIGAGGNGGPAGASPGGNGGSGLIVIEEFYN